MFRGIPSGEKAHVRKSHLAALQGMFDSVCSECPGNLSVVLSCDHCMSTARSLRLS